MKTMKTMMIGTMVIVLLVCAAGAQAETIVIQDGLTVNGSDYWNTKDAKLHGGAPDTNFNEYFNTVAEAYWQLGWRGYPEHTLIKFAGLDFLSGQYISIDSVTLTLRSTSVDWDKVADLYIQQVASSNNWVDSTATWNNNGASPWASGVPGLEGTGDTIGTISTLSIVSVDPNRLEEYVFDLDTAAVVSWIEGGFDNTGMIIRPVAEPSSGSGTSTDPINFWSEDNSIQTNRPILTIEYTVPEPMTIVVMSCGAIGLLRRRKRA